MPRPSSNKSRGHHVPASGGSDWFQAGVRRRHRRKWLALLSKRKNRKRK